MYTPGGAGSRVRVYFRILPSTELDSFFFFNLILFFPFIFIHWRLITLQYCSGFCHTLT